MQYNYIIPSKPKRVLQGIKRFKVFIISIAYSLYHYYLKLSLQLVFNPWKTMVFLIVFQIVLKIGIFTEIVFAAEPDKPDTDQNQVSMAYTIWTKVYHVLTLGGANPDFKHETDDHEEMPPVVNIVDYESSGNITINFMMNIWDWCTGNGPYKYVNQNNDEVHEAPVPIPAPIAEIPMPIPEVPVPILEGLAPNHPYVKIDCLSDVLVNYNFNGLSEYTKAIIRNYMSFRQTILETPDVTSPNTSVYGALFSSVATYIQNPTTTIVDEIALDLHTIIVLTDNPDAKALTQAYMHVIIGVNTGVAEYQDEFCRNDPDKLTKIYVQCFYQAQKAIQEALLMATPQP